MKKTALLNQALSSTIAAMGHTDALVIADAGLPIPKEVSRIDLAVSEGVPGFFEVLKATLSELKVEEALIAREMKEKSPEVFEALKELLADIPIKQVPHELFKERTRVAQAIVRTGEFTPYANVMLIAGVVF